MAGILKVDQVQSDSNLAFAIAGSNVAFMNATSLQMVGSNVSLAGTNVITNGKVVVSGMPVGAVVQVVRSEYTTLTSTTSTSTWSNVGSATITPTSASNKILITTNYHVSGIGSLRLLRGATTLNNPTNTYMTYSKYANDNQAAWNGNSDRHTLTMQYYDSPATTSSTTYNMEMIAYSIAGTTGFGVNELHGGVTFSGFTLMEIAA
jgi:hypothetical protein